MRRTTLIYGLAFVSSVAAALCLLPRRQQSDRVDVSWIAKAANIAKHDLSDDNCPESPKIRLDQYLPSLKNVEFWTFADSLPLMEGRFGADDFVDHFLWICAYEGDLNSIKSLLANTTYSDRRDMRRASAVCSFLRQGKQDGIVTMASEIESDYSYVLLVLTLTGKSFNEIDGHVANILIATAAERMEKIDFRAPFVDYIPLTAAFALRCSEMNCPELCDRALACMIKAVEQDSRCREFSWIAIQALVISGKHDDALQIVAMNEHSEWHERDLMAFLPWAVSRNRERELLSTINSPIVRVKVALLLYLLYAGGPKDMSAWEQFTAEVRNLPSLEIADSVFDWYLSCPSVPNHTKRLSELSDVLFGLGSNDNNPVSQFSAFRRIGISIWLNTQDVELMCRFLDGSVQSLSEFSKMPLTSTNISDRLDTTIIGAAPDMFASVGYKLCIESYLKCGLRFEAHQLLAKISDLDTRNTGRIDLAGDCWSRGEFEHARVYVESQEAPWFVKTEDIAMVFASNSLHAGNWNAALAVCPYLKSVARQQLLVYLSGNLRSEQDASCVSLPVKMRRQEYEGWFELGQYFGSENKSMSERFTPVCIFQATEGVTDWSGGLLQWVLKERAR